jgi:hypothetical protein
LNDGVTEITNPIYNYIKRNGLTIKNENIVGVYVPLEFGIFELGPI